MIGSMEEQWIQGNYWKVAWQIQKRTDANLVAFFSPDCRLLESVPTNDTLKHADCSAADREYPGSVLVEVSDPSGRVGKVIINKKIDRLSIFLASLLQVIAYTIALMIVYFSVFKNFFKNELSMKVREMLPASGDEPARFYQEFEPLYRVLQDYRRQIGESVAAEKERVFKTELAVEFGKLAAQVAHDIRSPLAALDSALVVTSDMPEDSRLILRSAAGRIRDIANGLIEKNRELHGAVNTSNDALSDELLSGLVESIVAEKRMQYRGTAGVAIAAEFDGTSYGIFSRINPVEFKRALSNLINNSVESLREERGTVQIRLSAGDGRAYIRVIDDGKGIPPDLIARLGVRGDSHDKPGGTGLGLYHARNCVRAWGGRIDIESAVGRGTEIILELPQSAPPDWFVFEIVLVDGKSVVILDDDPGIHGLWQGRLDLLQKSARKIVSHHFYAPEEMREWMRSNPDEAGNALYLLDNEFRGQQETGVSLAKELSIVKQSILVTGRHEEPEILEACLRLEMRLIPKGLAGSVPLRFQP